MVKWIDFKNVVVLIMGVGVGIGWVFIEEVLWCGVYVIVVEWDVEVFESLSGLFLIKVVVDVSDVECMCEIVV